MLPSDLTLSVLRFILSAKSRQSCKQDCETVDFCNSLIKGYRMEPQPLEIYIGLSLRGSVWLSRPAGVA
ncbi:hypothetical protein HMPREF9294_1578 [Porphyromonas asaccharolytica PR426713P-I]|nr:hypothetical protein HMPREF9294_1578 [Porphyromonas asaccharolytica PR426713P-I]